MVRFTKNSIVLEINANNPFYEYLQLLQAINTLGWYISDGSSTDEQATKAYSKVAFYVGTALSEMPHEEALRIDRLACIGTPQIEQG